MSAYPNNINYVREVTASFTDHCPKAATLAPNDFAIIAEWEKQEIPLEVILRSIREVWDEHHDFTRSITDIRDKVKRDFIIWLQTTGTQAGM